MGLDGVELIMSIEEAFGISITDEEAGNIRTPRQLINVVVRKLETTDRQVCATQRAFYTVRKALHAEFGVSRRAVTPRSSLEGLFPTETRYDNWQELLRRLGLRNPKLGWPGWTSSLARTMGILLTVVFGAIVWLMVEHPWYRTMYLLFSPLVFLFGLGTSMLVLHQHRTVLPLTNVGELSAWISTHSPTSLKIQSWSPQGAAEAVRGIIRSELGIEEFSDDADFVNDLNLN